MHAHMHLIYHIHCHKGVNSYCGYISILLLQEFKSFGIKYAKVRCPVKEIPRLIYLEYVHLFKCCVYFLIDRFAEVLQDHLALKNQGDMQQACM